MFIEGSQAKTIVKLTFGLKLLSPLASDARVLHLPQGIRRVVWNSHTSDTTQTRVWNSGTEAIGSAISTMHELAVGYESKMASGWLTCALDSLC